MVHGIKLANDVKPVNCERISVVNIRSVMCAYYWL